MAKRPKFPSKMAASAMRSVDLFASRSMQLKYGCFALSFRNFHFSIVFLTFWRLLRTLRQLQSRKDAEIEWFRSKHNLNCSRSACWRRKIEQFVTEHIQNMQKSAGSPVSIRSYLRNTISTRAVNGLGPTNCDALRNRWIYCKMKMYES